MALRGKPPEAIQKRLKALFYGPAGVGKTMAAIQFPAPYLIDTERGAENAGYVAALKAAGGAYWFTVDADEMIEEVRNLLSTKHKYRTLVIDPLTVLYNDLLDKSSASLATKDDPTGTAFGRHKGPADKKVKHLLSLLLRLDMNVVITSHAKTKWEKNGKEIVDAGQTFDCYAKLDYLFDLAFEVQFRGKDRVGIVRKSRLDAFPLGDVFPFGYDEIAARYGRDVLERDAKPEALGSPEQIATLVSLLDARKDGDELREKWLSKAGAEAFDEMPSDAIEKCIHYLRGEAAGKAA
jgi:hypothetical protein